MREPKVLPLLAAAVAANLGIISPLCFVYTIPHQQNQK